MQMSGTFVAEDDFVSHPLRAPSGADVVAEDAEDEIVVQGIENQ